MCAISLRNARAACGHYVGNRAARSGAQTDLIGATMIQYLVVECNAIEELEEDVQILIEQGWEPIGGVAIEGGSAPIGYLQAMIRRPVRLPVGKLSQK